MGSADKRYAAAAVARVESIANRRAQDYARVCQRLATQASTQQSRLDGLNTATARQKKKDKPPMSPNAVRIRQVKKDFQASSIQFSEEVKGKYTKLKTLGKGSFGGVNLVRCKDDGKLYAMKIINMERTVQSVKEVLQEVKVLKVMGHPNIVSFHDVFSSKQGRMLCMVMSYCEMGDLQVGRLVNLPFVLSNSA
jgi:serine/threonine protein kinase